MGRWVTGLFYGGKMWITFNIIKGFSVILKHYIFLMKKFFITKPSLNFYKPD